MFLSEKTDNEVGVGGYAAPAVLVGGGLAGLKASADTDRFAGRVYDWYDSVEGVRASDGGSWRQMKNAIDKYVDGGRRAMRSRILGLPVPYAMTRGVFTNMEKLRYYKGDRSEIFKIPIRKARLQAAERILPSLGFPNNILDGLRRGTEYKPEIKGLIDHYNVFYRGSAEDVRKYMVQKHIPWDRMSDRARNIMRDETIPYLSRFRKISLLGPQDKAAMSGMASAVVGRLSGVGNQAGGLARLYADTTGTIAPPVSKILRRGDVLALGAGLGLGLQGLTKSSSWEDTLGYGAAGAGVARGGLNILSGPDVGITFSEIPHHGDGHKGPGNALKDIVEELRAKGRISGRTKIDVNAKGRFGAPSPRFYGKKYDTLIDTGMGMTNLQEWGGQKNIFVPGINKEPDIRGMHRSMFRPPRVATGGYVGYTTDAGKFGSPLYGYMDSYYNPGKHLPRARFLKSLIGRRVGLRDSYLSWGPEKLFAHFNKKDHSLDRLKAMGLQQVHAGAGFPTARGPAREILEELNDPSTTRAQKNSQYIDDLLASDALDPEQKKRLAAMRHKKIIAISGSGRGDYVGTRVRDLSKELRRRGLDRQFGIFALSGSPNDPILNSTLRNTDNVVSVGRMPQRQYIGIPGTAYAHWGSTGASAVGESVATPTRLFYIPKASKIRDREQRLLQRLASRGRVNPKYVASHAGVNLDDWNPGNRMWAWGDRGARKAQSAKELIDQILRMEGGSVEKRLAVASRNMLGKMAPTRDKIGDHLARVINRQHRYRMLKGGGLVGMGLGVLGTTALSASGRENDDRGNTWLPDFLKS